MIPTFPNRLIADAGELYRRYHPLLYAYLLRLSGNPQDAQELLAETFYRAIRGAASYRGDAPPVAWLSAIARHAFADMVKKRQRERSQRVEAVWETLPDTAGLTPEAAALNRELNQQIRLILESLPETQRLALLLRDADGLPYESIAEMLDLSLPNVKVTIHRARLTFRALYLARKE